MILLKLLVKRKLNHIKTRITHYTRNNIVYIYLYYI